MFKYILRIDGEKMKIININLKGYLRVVLISCIIIILLLNLAGYIFDCKYLSVSAAVAQGNKYEVRNELLMEAMNNVGVCDADAAANVWASGLKKRSAALQYSVMTEKLKKNYEKELETTAPNWVTGVSSPWVESYRIVKTEAPSRNQRTILLNFSTLTSTGPAGDYNAQLTIKQEGDFWLISDISLDKELYSYTGFAPT